jgi:PASTA domain
LLAPHPAAPSRRVTVPDVRGLFFSVCLPIAGKAGLRIVTVRLTEHPMPVDGLVVGQSPEAAARARRGSALTVRVWHPPARSTRAVRGRPPAPRLSDLLSKRLECRGRGPLTWPAAPVELRRGNDAMTTFEGLRLPVVAAPMFLISGPDLVVAACKSGIIGSFPAPNCRTVADLDSWMGTISDRLAGSGAAPWAVNLVTHSTNARLADDLRLVAEYKPAVGGRPGPAFGPRRRAGRGRGRPAGGGVRRGGEATARPGGRVAG